MTLKCSYSENCLNFREKVALVAHTVTPHSQLLLELPFSLQMDDQMLINPFQQEPKPVVKCVISNKKGNKLMALLKHKIKSQLSSIKHDSTRICKTFQGRLIQYGMQAHCTSTQERREINSSTIFPFR